MKSNEGEAAPSRSGRPPRVAVSEIVDIAARLFGARGLRGASIVAVAQEAGLSDAGVLHHFPTKSALIDAVIERSAQTQTDRMQELVAPGGLPALRAMSVWGEVVVSTPELASLQTVLSTEALLDESPIRETITQRYVAVRDLAAGLMRQGIARGEIRPDIDAEKEAIGIVAFLDGVRLQWLLSGRELPIVDLTRGFFEDLADRIAVAPGEPVQ